MKNEFGLGPYEVGAILLTHPERLVGDQNELFVDCPGAEYSPEADGEFVWAPYFYWYDGRLSFNAYWVEYAHAYYGSASGFLPQ